MTSSVLARCYCSLGPMISANLADTYLQAAGLVKCRGSVELVGLVMPPVGTRVEFAYVPVGGRRAARVPRVLRVTSVSADPLRGRTKVELGCLLTFMENRKPALTNPSAYQENSNATCAVFQDATLPLSTAYVLQRCLDAIGMTAAAPIPLQSRKSQIEYDLSGGYVAVMDELLESEGLIGYVDEAEQLAIRSLEDGGSYGPVMGFNDLLDCSPIGAGEIAGDAVVVRFSSRRLKAPPGTLGSDERRRRNWEQDANQGGLQIRNLDGQTITRAMNGTTVVFPTVSYRLSYSWRPSQTTTTQYDTWDRVTTRETTRSYSEVEWREGLMRAFLECWPGQGAWEKINQWEPYYNETLGPANGYRWQDRFFFIDRSYGNEPSPSAQGTWAQLFNPQSEWSQYGAWPTRGRMITALPATDRTVVRYVYKANPSKVITGSGYGVNCIADAKPDNYSDVLYEITEQYEPLGKVLSAALTSYFGVGSDGLYGLTVRGVGMAARPVLICPPRGEQTLTSRTIVSYEKDMVSGITKTKRETWKARIYTQNGAQQIRDELNLVSAAVDMVNVLQKAADLIYEDVDTTIRTEREFGLQKRPRVDVLSNAANDNASKVQEQADLAWVTGELTSQTVVELSLPVAPDDWISYNATTATYTQHSSNASAVALRYGRIQNRLRFGNRNGLSMRLPMPLMPTRPFDPIYLKLGGAMAQYRVNGTSIVMGPDGIVASCDALFWGAAAT